MTGRYPYDGAGHKDVGAGKDAAEAFQHKLGPRQAEMLHGLRLYGPCTADDIALKIGRPVHSSRPRMSELERKGEVIKLDERRASAFGSRQHVYRLADEADRALFLARQAGDCDQSDGVQ